jgi:hypothetical protein
MNIEPGELILSANRALWGVVTPNLRRVAIHCEEKLITLSFFYDNKISDAEEELALDAVAEVIADFPDDFDIKDELVQIAFPNRLSDKGYTVYHRHE